MHFSGVVVLSLSALAAAAPHRFNFSQPAVSFATAPSREEPSASFAAPSVHKAPSVHTREHQDSVRRSERPHFEFPKYLNASATSFTIHSSSTPMRLAVESGIPHRSGTPVQTTVEQGVAQTTGESKRPAFKPHPFNATLEKPSNTGTAVGSRGTGSAESTKLPILGSSLRRDALLGESESSSSSMTSSSTSLSLHTAPTAASAGFAFKSEAVNGAAPTATSKPFTRFTNGTATAEAERGPTGTGIAPSAGFAKPTEHPRAFNSAAVDGVAKPTGSVRPSGASAPPSSFTTVTNSASIARHATHTQTITNTLSVSATPSATSWKEEAGLLGILRLRAVATDLPLPTDVALPTGVTSP